MGTKLDIKLMNKILLQNIEQNEGSINWNNLQSRTKAHFYTYRIFPIPNNKQLNHRLYLFEKEGIVEILKQPPEINYNLTPWGHAFIGPWYKKWGYFLLYKKHNLTAIIALILSIVSIFLSDRVWNWVLSIVK